MDPTLSTKIQGDLIDLREELRAKHGVCHIEIDVAANEATRTVTLRGEVLVDRLRAVVLGRVRTYVGPRWSIQTQLEVVQGGPWFEVLRPISLLDRCPQADRAARLVTELGPHDGPLEQLGSVGTFALWRDRCGTVGWADATLGPACAPFELPSPHDPDPRAFVAAARRFLDVPYRLGGTTDAGIDCSALIQRAAWTSLQVALPRNSGDLWALGSREGRPPAEPGHLVFTWTPDESLRHVAVTDHEALVHASLSRGRVVADPWPRFVGASHRLEWLPFETIVALGQRCAGEPNLLAAGIRLGDAG